MPEKENRKACSSEFSSCECGTEERNLDGFQIVALKRGYDNIKEEEEDVDDDGDDAAAVGLPHKPAAF